VYSDADIYLLDDPLSAVDTKVGRNLFKSCILKYLSGHIRLLVTHQLQYLKDLDHIAVMKNGTIAHQGGYSELADQGVFSGMLDVSQRLEDDPVGTRSVSLDEFNKRVTPMQKPRAATSESHEIGHDIELHKLLEEDVTSEVGVGFMKGASALRNTRSRSRVSECEAPETDHRPVLDLKEDEEVKTTGTVTWRLYWDYFKAGLPVPLIILLAFVLIVAQGNKSIQYPLAAPFSFHTIDLSLKFQSNVISLQLSLQPSSASRIAFKQNMICIESNEKMDEQSEMLFFSFSTSLLIHKLSAYKIQYTTAKYNMDLILA